ncbi:MAG: RNB domain-containing ribonuclease [Pyrinomonadaceae bacterium]
MNDHGSSSWLTERAHQAMLDNGFEPAFSGEVYAQLRQIADRGEPSHGSDVQDLRHLLWSSIDNRTSRDLDQVEWAERLENGDIRVLVGIADVDVRVPKGTPIDVHAAQNTVSVRRARSFRCCPRSFRPI